MHDDGGLRCGRLQEEERKISTELLVFDSGLKSRKFPSHTSRERALLAAIERGVPLLSVRVEEIVNNHSAKRKKFVLFSSPLPPMTSSGKQKNLMLSSPSSGARNSPRLWECWVILQTICLIQSTLHFGFQTFRWRPRRLYSLLLCIFFTIHILRLQSRLNSVVQCCIQHFRVLHSLAVRYGRLYLMNHL